MLLQSYNLIYTVLQHEKMLSSFIWMLLSYYNVWVEATVLHSDITRTLQSSCHNIWVDTATVVVSFSCYWCFINRIIFLSHLYPGVCLLLHIQIWIGGTPACSYNTNSLVASMDQYNLYKTSIMPDWSSPIREGWPPISREDGSSIILFCCPKILVTAGRERGWSEKIYINEGRRQSPVRILPYFLADNLWSKYSIPSAVVRKSICCCMYGLDWPKASVLQYRWGIGKK